jgi:hypothetical protein
MRPAAHLLAASMLTNNFELSNNSVLKEPICKEINFRFAEHVFLNSES